MLVLCRIQETIETVKLQHLCSVWLVPPLEPIKLLYRPFRAIFHRQYYFKLPACVSMIGHIPAAERYKIPKDVFTPFFHTYVWLCGSTSPRVFWGRNTELSFLAQSIGIWISSLNCLWSKAKILITSVSFEQSGILWIGKLSRPLAELFQRTGDQGLV